MTTTTHTGRCLCGAVTFVGHGELHGVEACHCRDCRRWTGGPWLNVDFKDGVEIAGPLRWHRSSEWAERGFCATCGSTLFWRMTKAGSATMSAAAGALDDESPLVGMTKHIFVDSQPGYYAFADSAPRIGDAEMVARRQARLGEGGPSS